MSESNDSAFLRMFLFVLGALVAFTAIIMFVAGMVTEDLDAKRAGDSRLQAVVAERIAPVGSVEVAAANAAPAEPKAGDVVVAEACASCHSSGVLGAPKIGEKGDWENRMADGLDGLTASAIAGKGAMPPRGGAAALSDDEIRAAVAHMLKESGIDAGADAAAAAPAPAAEEKSVTEEVVEAASGAVDSATETAGNMMDSMMGAAGSMASAMMPGSAEPAAPAVDLAKGKAVYDQACFACHFSGAAGAPKVGDAGAWTDRIAAGLDAMTSSAINGKGAMPAKGGRPDISDDDIRAAVAYMLDQSK